MTFYTDLRGTATALLADKGRPITLRKRSAGAYDPSTGTTAVTDAVYTVSAVTRSFPERLIDGQMIRSGDVRVTIQAGVAEPVEGDRLTVDGTEMSVVRVRPVSPGGVPVIYVVQARVGG